MNHVAWHVLRAVALSMGAALGAFALTAVFRHTVATLALLFIYSVGGEIAVNLLPFEGAGRWSVGNNAVGWLATHHRYFDATIICTPGERCSSMQVMTHLEAGTFLGDPPARRGGRLSRMVRPPRRLRRPLRPRPRRHLPGSVVRRLRRTVADVTQAPEQAVPAGRKLLRLEVRNAETPIERKPEWIKTRAKMGPQYTELQHLVKSEGLHTVCQEAGCPNIYECWEDREATFLIGGDQCTRRCDFCQIDTGKPQPLDRDEPRRVAESVQTMGLRYATITGVARDDLPDGGAWLYAETVRMIHELNPDTGVENLIPDFNGNPDQLLEVFESRPEVLAHNVETVPRIFKRIRPAFRYDRSLDVITQARDFGLVTKSNLILGMGETREEIHQALVDLHAAGCELITITQYLRPSPRHHPVERWVKPEEFVEMAAEAEEIGFAGVLSGPLVRSSYRAGRLYKQAIEARGAATPCGRHRLRH